MEMNRNIKIILSHFEVGLMVQINLYLLILSLLLPKFIIVLFT